MISVQFVRVDHRRFVPINVGHFDDRDDRFGRFLQLLLHVDGNRRNQALRNRR